MTWGDLPANGWELLGVVVVAIAGITIAWINGRKADTKLGQLEQKTDAVSKQLSNGQKTLMRDDLVEVRDTVLCLRATLEALSGTVERIENRQVSAAGQLGALTARVDDLAADLRKCPLHINPNAA